MAPNLAMKMAAMFGGGSDDEEGRLESLKLLRSRIMTGHKQVVAYPFRHAGGDASLSPFNLYLMDEIFCNLFLEDNLGFAVDSVIYYPSPPHYNTSGNADDNAQNPIPRSAN
ncbi:hypothetical protein NC653_018946 [Populus alba x Populus x berolinensis]|uniref:Uncharacterized protein n=1 Tax=Populus alba x Populus x berolinensis TaxID=444605 RepID=A0AAD6QHM0_9ROSI|nr:hypothetical protein NC653_018946 [Populus alba x Populus x berolinensis]